MYTAKILDLVSNRKAKRKSKCGKCSTYRTIFGKSTKKPLVDNFSKILSELEFNSNHSIKWKCLKWVVKNILPTI